MGPFLFASAFLLDILQAGITALLISIPGVGIPLAIAVNTTISLTLGSGHTFALYLDIREQAGRLKIRIEAMLLRRILLFFFSKTLPILNNLPLFTLSTFLAYRAIKKEEEKGADGAEGGQGRVVPFSKRSDKIQNRIRAEGEGGGPSESEGESDTPVREPLRKMEDIRHNKKAA